MIPRIEMSKLFHINAWSRNAWFRTLPTIILSNIFILTTVCSTETGHVRVSTVGNAKTLSENTIEML